MPRRDGLPTNEEMLVDFTALSHQVFLNAYENEFDGGLPDSYKDKPLSLLRLRIGRISLMDYGMSVWNGKELPEVHRPPRESLSIEPISQNTADMLHDHLQYKKRPEFVLARYADIADTLAATALTNTLNIHRVFPMEATDASYTARFVGGPNRWVSTFSEKPVKQSIAAGKYFAQEALEYIDSDAFKPTNPLASFVEQILDPSDEHAILDHGFSFEITASLPLNGHEPKDFIEIYAAKMFAQMMQLSEYLERFEALGAPDIILDPRREQYERVKTAYLAAQKYLDQK